MKSALNMMYRIKCEFSELRLSLNRQQEVFCISVFAQNYFANEVFISLSKKFYRRKHFVLSKWCTKARRHVFLFERAIM